MILKARHLLFPLVIITIHGGLCVLEAIAGQLVIFDENPFNGSPRGFYGIDLITREQRLLRQVAPSSDRFTGFAWDPLDGRVYMGSSEGRLYSIDLEAGDPNLIGQVPVNVGSGQSKFIRGIAFQPSTHQMFGLGFGPRVYRINKVTADSSEVGISPDLDGGLAFAPDGRLFGWATRFRLLELDPDTAQGTILSEERFDPLSDITITQDGRLFGVNNQFGRIIEIDLDTGIGATFVEFPEHQSGMIGIFYVPEPSALVLLWLGMSSLLGFVIFSSRRRRA